MKTIGLLGGMSWESTANYYRLINEATRNALGGLHSAPIAMISVDFEEIENLQRAGDWDAMAEILAKRAAQVENAGAEFLLICTNTMHRVADEIAAVIDIPLLHIADATASVIEGRGARKVGLLGTKFTMEQDFYRGRLERHGLEVVIPEACDRDIVHQVIYEELCIGKIVDASRQEYLRIIDDLERRGAELVIAGCTEIGLLVRQADTQAPLLDTTEIHAQHAVAEALA